MIDVFLLILCLVVIGILMVVNVYLVAYYSHVEDQGSPIAMICKVIVVFTLLLCEGQQLLLTVDASNSRGAGGGFNMALLWRIFYLTLFVDLGLLLPFSIFLYQTDFQQPLWKRIATTFCQIIITVGAVSVLTFVSYIYLSQAQMPITLVSTTTTIFNQSSDNTLISSFGTSSTLTDIIFQIGIPEYIIGLMCFFGYFILILCGGCGLSALPLDLIMQFRIRPRHIRTSQAKAKKEQFKALVADLIVRGQELKRRMKGVEFSAGWWNKRKKQAETSRVFTQFEQQAIESEDRFQLYKMQLDIQNTSMATFVVKLLLGIFCSFLTILWWLQILLSQLLQINGKRVNGLFDDLLLWFQKQNANFVGVIWFMVMTQYLVFCILKGSFRFGVRIPFLFSFHPMKQGKTWMNSFLFNLSIVALGSVAIVHLCSGCFPGYLRSTSISAILVYQVDHLKFFKYFFQYKVFIYGLVIWAPLISVYVVIRGVRKPDILKRIQEKRAKLKIKPVEKAEYQMAEIPVNKKIRRKLPRKQNPHVSDGSSPKSSHKKHSRTQKSRPKDRSRGNN